MSKHGWQWPLFTILLGREAGGGPIPPGGSFILLDGSDFLLLNNTLFLLL